MATKYDSFAKGDGMRKTLVFCEPVLNDLRRSFIEQMGLRFESEADCAIQNFIDWMYIEAEEDDDEVKA